MSPLSFQRFAILLNVWVFGVIAGRPAESWLVSAAVAGIGVGWCVVVAWLWGWEVKR